MAEPEDKGSRYRLVMFIAIAAILLPGWFLLNWLGDNGLSNLMRGFLGLDTRPRVTRTVAPATTTPTLALSPTENPSQNPSSTPTRTAAPAAATVATTVAPPPPTATTRPTQAPAPTQAPEPATATATAAPPKPTATNTPRPPAPTPTPQGLGWGTAVPAYGGAAVIRAEPNSQSAAIASIPLGDRVYVFRLVEGEAIDPVESRWWEVNYQGIRGFVYYKLIKLDE